MLNGLAPASPPALPESRPVLIWGLLAAGSAAVVALGMALGLPLLAVVALCGVGAWVVFRGSLRWAAFIPLLLIPAPVAHIPPHEVGLLLLCSMLVILGLARRAPWLTRADPIEVAVACLILWAAFTGLWSSDVLWYLYNIRKMLMGLLALWAASRLGAWVSREDRMLGIALAALGISAATLARFALVTGTSPGQTVSRNAATDIGWGSSNYITAIVVLMAPSVLRVAARDQRRLALIAAWITLPLIVVVAMVSGSRGGVLLILLTTLIVAAIARVRRRRWWLALALLFALLIFGPGATDLLGRFTKPLEFSSVAARLYFFHIGWIRLIEHLPWGMGLGQELVIADELLGGDPHNYLLTIGGELGMPGLVLWCVVIAMIWRRSGAMMRARGGGFDGMAMRVTLVIAVANSLFEPTLFGLHYHFLFYWILGAQLGLEASPEPARTPSAGAGTVPRAR